MTLTAYMILAQQARDKELRKGKTMRMNICQACYDLEHPGTATVLFQSVRDTCDFCGKPNTDGIYIRVEENPNAQKQSKAQE